MGGCRVCQSVSLLHGQRLSCGHRFCADCLLALLPDPTGRFVRPAHIACPRCRKLCEYARVREDDRRASGTSEAPSTFADEEETRRRQRKRAQFVHSYWTEYVSRPQHRYPRIRYFFEEDRRDTLPGRTVSGRRSAVARAGTREQGGGARPARRTVRDRDDVRALDHVNGRFVTCLITTTSGEEPRYCQTDTEDLRTPPARRDSPGTPAVRGFSPSTRPSTPAAAPPRKRTRTWAQWNGTRSPPAGFTGVVALLLVFVVVLTFLITRTF